MVRRKPGSAKGVLFIAIQDETGVANCILWPDRFEAQRRTVMSAAMVTIIGRVQLVHVIIDRIVEGGDLLRRVGEMSFPHRTGRSDGARLPLIRAARVASFGPLSIDVLRDASARSGERRVDIAAVRLASNCLVRHCPERCPLALLLGFADQDSDVALSQGANAAFNGIVRQLRLADRHDG